MNPVALEWAARLRSGLLTVQDHRYFCPTRGKWTAAGDVCRRAMSREACASCFKDQAYFDEVLGLTERRLAAVRRLQVSVLSRCMREELAAVPCRRERPRRAAVRAGPRRRPAPTGRRACSSSGGWRRRRRARGGEGVAALRRRTAAGGSGHRPVRAELEAEAARPGARRSRCWLVGRERLSVLDRSSGGRSSFLRAGRSRSGSWGSRRSASACRWWRGSPGAWEVAPGPGSCAGRRGCAARALAKHAGRGLLLLPRFDRDEAIGRADGVVTDRLPSAEPGRRSNGQTDNGNGRDGAVADEPSRVLLAPRAPESVYLGSVHLEAAIDFLPASS